MEGQNCRICGVSIHANHHGGTRHRCATTKRERLSNDSMLNSPLVAVSSSPTPLQQSKKDDVFSDDDSSEQSFRTAKHKRLAPQPAKRKRGPDSDNEKEEEYPKTVRQREKSGSAIPQRRLVARKRQHDMSSHTPAENVPTSQQRFYPQAASMPPQSSDDSSSEDEYEFQDEFVVWSRKEPPPPQSSDNSSSSSEDEYQFQGHYMGPPRKEPPPSSASPMDQRRRCGWCQLPLPCRCQRLQPTPQNTMLQTVASATTQQQTEYMAAAHLLQDTVHDYIVQNNPSENESRGWRLTESHAQHLQQWSINVRSRLQEENRRALEQQEMIRSQQLLQRRVQRERERVRTLQSKLRQLQATNKQLESDIQTNEQEQTTRLAATAALDAIEELRNQNGTDQNGEY